MIMHAVDQFGDCMYCRPEASELETGNFDGHLTMLVAQTDGTENQLADAVRNISEVVSVEARLWSMTQTAGEGTTPTVAQPPASGNKPIEQPRLHVEQTIRVPVERLDRLMNLLSELVIDKTRLTSLAAELGDVDLRALSEHMARVSSRSSVVCHVAAHGSCGYVVSAVSADDSGTCRNRLTRIFRLKWSAVKRSSTVP